MAKNESVLLDTVLSGPLTSADRARPLEDPQAAEHQRILDEILGRPSSLPSDKLQVIKETAPEAQSLKETKTPEQIAIEYSRKAVAALDAVHKDLKFTTDKFEPRVVAYRDKVLLATDKTPLEIAQGELGDRATPEQLAKYADTLIKLNELGGGHDDLICEGTHLRFPGQRSDGAITYREKGVSHADWLDGSTYEQSERGKGTVKLKEKDGAEVGFAWNPDDADETAEIRTSGDRQIETSPTGLVTENARVGGKWLPVSVTMPEENGRTLSFSFDPGAEQPKQIIVKDKVGDTTVLAPDEKGHFKGVKTDRSGDVVDADMHLVIDRATRKPILYSRKEADDKSVTKTFENGVVESLNKDGQLVNRVGKDAWSRSVVEEYTAGEALPHTIKVTPRGEDTIVFQKRPFGEYQSEYKNSAGEKIGTIALKPDGLIIYNDDNKQTARGVLRDGTELERQTLANGRQQIVETRDGETLTQTIDRQGSVIDAEYAAKDGQRIKRKLSADGDSIAGITLTDKSGFRTEMSYDRDLGVFTGTRVNARGEAVEKVFHMQGKLVYTDLESGATRSERLNFNQQSLFGVKSSPAKYDGYSGTVTYPNSDGSQTCESFAPGRTDIVKDGTVTGSTIRGEKSLCKSTGETVVHNADGTGARLNTDGTVDRWGPKSADNASGEPLTKAEGAYLRNHPDVDRRDFLEIHRQFLDRPEMLDRFYEALAKVDDAPNLSADERTALRKGLVRHVAQPAELYQGNSWACNVATVEREMVINMPDVYVNRMVDALSKESFVAADGATIDLRRANLRVPDSTGRDFVTRAFHAMALNARFQPTYVFTNTEDGVGRLVPTAKNMKPAPFVGLDMQDIATARYKMTGEKRAVYDVNSVDDLVKAFEANGGRSMIVAVNANKPPFSGGASGFGMGDSPSSPNHVVTVTKVESGPPVRFYVQNQWGLKADLSTPATAVDADTLLKSMKGRVRWNRDRSLADTPAQVIAPGEPGKTYFYKSGVVVEEKRARS